jgi:hypothetical protein
VDGPGQPQDRVGRSVDLGVDVGRFHFFDRDSGLAIGHPDTAGNDRSAALSLR